MVTGTAKPRFFAERAALFEVHPESGMLWNTEAGSPMVPIGEADVPEPLFGSTAPAHVAGGGGGGGGGEPARARVFQGGSHLDVHRMLDVTAGSQVRWGVRMHEGCVFVDARMHER